MTRVEIEAYVSEIQGNRAGDRSEKARISASYECANVHSSLTFDVPISEARYYWVGQKLALIVEPR